MAEIPESDLDPYDVANILAPYAYHAELRDLGPVVWLRRYGTYAVSRFGVVTEVLGRPTEFLSSGGVGLSDPRKPGSWRPSSPIAEVDPPQHGIVRKTMNRIVSPRLIREWRDHFAALADEAATRVERLGTFDAVTELVEPFVVAAFSGALGVEMHQENLIIVGNHSFNASGPRNALFEASAKRAAEVSDWFEHNQTAEAMRSGGFGEQVFAAEAAGELPAGTASPMLRTLIRGGMDTTISALGTCLRLLAQSPDWWSAAREEPKLVHSIFDEAIRLESPVQSVYRTTAADCVLGEYRLTGDTKVQVMLGAANRDPEAFPDPDRFDPRRWRQPHVAFGFGVHNCLGHMIARQEAEALLTALLRRWPSLSLAGEPRYRAINVLRTLDSLPIAVSGLQPSREGMTQN